MTIPHLQYYLAGIAKGSMPKYDPTVGLEGLNFCAA